MEFIQLIINQIRRLLILYFQSVRKMGKALHTNKQTDEMRTTTEQVRWRGEAVMKENMQRNGRAQQHKLMHVSGVQSHLPSFGLFSFGDLISVRKQHEDGKAQGSKSKFGVFLYIYFAFV